MPVAFVYLITPNIINTQMLGPESYMISLSFAIASCIGMILVLPMGALGMVFEKVQREWCKRINIYLQQVQERLLKIADGVDSPEDMIARLALLQEENEAWAREMNHAYSMQNGLSVPTTLTWSFFPLAMIAFPSPEETRLAQVVVMDILRSAFSQIMFIVQLTGLTKAIGVERGQSTAAQRCAHTTSSTKHRRRARRICPGLQNHELNAARACGVKVTLKLLHSSAGSIAGVYPGVASGAARESEWLVGVTEGTCIPTYSFTCSLPAFLSLSSPCRL